MIPGTREMMRIIFERSGGMMGLKISLSLDLDDLPDSQSDRLRQLINAADFFNLAGNLVERVMPDEFLYTLTVETDTRQHTVRTSDTTAPDALRPLLNDLFLRARPRHK